MFSFSIIQFTKFMYHVLFDHTACLTSYLIFLSLYSIAFLKVGNMLNPGKVEGWEQGTVYNPQIIILPGMDPHKMVFDNPQWGAKNMLLPLVRSVSEARAEVKVFEGRLGIPWFYKNYGKDDVDNVRLIK